MWWAAEPHHSPARHGRRCVLCVCCREWFVTLGGGGQWGLTSSQQVRALPGDNAISNSVKHGHPDHPAVQFDTAVSALPPVPLPAVPSPARCPPYFPASTPQKAKSVQPLRANNSRKILHTNISHKHFNIPQVNAARCPARCAWGGLSVRQGHRRARHAPPGQCERGQRDVHHHEPGQPLAAPHHAHLPVPHPAGEAPKPGPDPTWPRLALDSEGDQIGGVGRTAPPF